MARCLSRCYLEQGCACFGECRKNEFASRIKAHVSKSSEAQQNLTITKTLTSHNVARDMRGMHSAFVDLTETVKKEAKIAVNNGSMTVNSIVNRIGEERAYKIPKLSLVQNLDQFFEIISPFYTFLDCHSIARLAVFLF